MADGLRLLDELMAVRLEAREDLMRRVKDIEQSYRLVAQKMGQLYMCADRHSVSSLTRSLDKPMRNASDNEQTFGAILEALQMAANRSR